MNTTSLQIATGAPLIQLWFGNFFEPWLSNRARVAEAMKDIAGPGNALAKAAIGIREEAVEFDCIDVGDRLLIPDGWTTVAYPGAEPLAAYKRHGDTAIGSTSRGRGRVISVGFPYGFTYATKRKPVPRGYHREVEAVGLQMLDDHPVASELRALRPERWCGGRGVETGWFDRSVVVVNHRNVPVDMSALLAEGAKADWQTDTGGRLLIPHSAVHIQKIGFDTQKRAFLNEHNSNQ